MQTRRRYGEKETGSFRKNSLDRLVVSRLAQQRSDLVSDFGIVLVEPLELVERHERRVDEVGRDRTLDEEWEGCVSGEFYSVWSGCIAQVWREPARPIRELFFLLLAHAACQGANRKKGAPGRATKEGNSPSSSAPFHST